MKPIAITMGDPAGVGPEICLRLLADEKTMSEVDVLVYGDLSILVACAHKLDLPAPDLSRVRDLAHSTVDHIEIGTVSKRAGLAAASYILAAIDDALAGHVSGIVTAPVNKEALHEAGILYPGHTEMFADHMKADRTCMLQVSDAITASFVTCHCGIHSVPDLITPERVLEVIELTHEAMIRIRGKAPLLVACGLNPHAGEHGLFGNNEEEEKIIPALEEARAKGIQIEGPLPPDTVFIPQNREKFDATICMYHDQGHIPLKALAFDVAVNTTLGLPIPRTSVDHGTAFDIAWQGKANPSSLTEAVKLCAKLAAAG